MEVILGCLAGIFVGFTAGGYMLLQPMAYKDKLIEEQKEENLQVCSENKELRIELDDIKFDLSVANKKIELQDKQIECIRTVLEQNSYGRDDIKIAKLKELVKEFQAIN